MEQIGGWLKENHIAITSIYYGGGTPTSITADQMQRLYAHMNQVFPNINDVREMTVEAGRPDTITSEKINVLKAYKIDRISINPQSFINETLQLIGRHHSAEETISKYKLAREMGIENINMDFIIGLPSEGVKELEYSLSQTRDLQPESITVHTLAFKKASKMTKQKGKYAVADAQEIHKMMNLAQQWAADNGYKLYYLYRQKNILGNLENVGYSLPGKESIYNIMIMEELQTIIGLGFGASTKLVHPHTSVISRFANPKEPRAYNQHFKQYTQDKLNKLERLMGASKLIT